MESGTTADVVLSFVGFYLFVLFLEIVSFYPTTSEKVFVFGIGVAGIYEGGEVGFGIEYIFDLVYFLGIYGFPIIYFLL